MSAPADAPSRRRPHPRHDLLNHCKEGRRPSWWSGVSLDHWPCPRHHPRHKHTACQGSSLAPAPAPESSLSSVVHTKDTFPSLPFTPTQEPFCGFFFRGRFCPHKGLFHFARSLSHFALCSRALPPNAPQPTSLVSLLTRHRPAHMAGCRRPSTPLGVVSNVSSLFFQSTKCTLKFPQLQPAPRPRHPRPNMPRYACTALVADPGSRACATSWDGWLTGRF